MPEQQGTVNVPRFSGSKISAGKALTKFSYIFFVNVKTLPLWVFLRSLIEKVKKIFFNSLPNRFYTSLNVGDNQEKSDKIKRSPVNKYSEERMANNTIETF